MIRRIDRCLMAAATVAREADRISNVACNTAPALLRDLRRVSGDPRLTPTPAQFVRFLRRIDVAVARVERRLRLEMALEGRAT